MLTAFAQPSFSPREYLESFRAQRKVHPSPHRTLTRRQSVLLRQIQTNTLPTEHLTHRFRNLPGTPTCSFCGGYPNIFHTIWACDRHPKLTPIPNPTLASWEASLADPSAATQLLLTSRAEEAMATASQDGALD